MHYLPERRKEKKAESIVMDKQQVLDQIFSNDPFGLLEVKAPPAPAFYKHRTAMDVVFFFEVFGRTASSH